MKLSLHTILLLASLPVLQAQISPFNRLAGERGILPVETFTRDYGQGAAVEDYDNDGDLDIFLATDRGMFSRLYQNDGSGYFRDVAEVSGIVDTGAVRAALWIDYNGDGLLDLLLAAESCPGWSCTDPIRLSLYRQTPAHTFEETTLEAGLVLDDAFDNLPFFAVGGLSAGDLNGDAYPDVLLSVWGGGVKLLINNGRGGFEDRTHDAGLELEEPTPWQAMMLDVNQDGKLDIYCNIDFAPNKLWINLGDGTFAERAGLYGLDHAFNEMGMAIADMDNDGDLDFYLTNITRNYQGTPQYNVLFEQQFRDGRVQFVETASGRGVAQSGWDWGTTWADLNNDGLVDLLTTNGWEDPRWPLDRSRVWLNTRGGFADISFAARFNDPFNGTTLLAFDLEGDGDLDILQTLKGRNSGLPMLIYENTLRQEAGTANYVVIKPRMPLPGQIPLGATVTLKAEDYVSSRLISAGNSFYGQEPALAFFGIGARTSIKEAAVRWPNGTVSVYSDLAINQEHTLWYDWVRAPEALTLEHKGNKIWLRWQDKSDNETGFELEYSRDSLFERVEVLQLTADTESYTMESPLETGTWFFRLRAFKEQVASAYANPVKVSLAPTPEAIPIAPAFLYPNPMASGEKLHLAALPGYEGEVQIRLYDTLGRLLHTHFFSASGSEVAYEINVGIPPGIYAVQIWQGITFRAGKLLVREAGT